MKTKIIDTIGVLEQSKKPNIMYMDLETEPLMMKEPEKNSQRGFGIIAIGDSGNVMDAHRIHQKLSDKDMIIVHSARGAGKQHFYHEMMHKTIDMEMSPEQVYNKIKTVVMDVSQKSLFGTPSPLKETYKERFRKKALQDYHNKQLEKQQRSRRIERTWIVDSTEWLAITSITDTAERQAFDKLLKDKFDKALGQMMYRASQRVEVMKNPNNKENE